MRPASVLAAIILLASASAATADPIPTPTLAGPIPAHGAPGSPAHDYPFFASNHDLPTFGYLESEYFVSGTANRYDTPPLTTGKIIDGGHPYKTRVIVRRPADPKQFNGVVLVEWLNVTNGFDADNTWFFSWEHIVHSGYAWVGISTQKVGVDRLKQWSPTRYGTLDVTDGGKITDDALSYDIYTQVGEALRHPTATDLLPGLQPRQIIAIGESQSAFRLGAYINAVDPLAHLYDGFLLLSAFGEPIRPDPSAPVFKLSTEYDVQAGDAAVRQPDSARFRAWEVAATSHVDQHLRASREPLELRDFGTSAEAQAAPTCAQPDIGTRTPMRDVVANAEDLLSAWVATGKAPPEAPKLTVTVIGDTAYSPGVGTTGGRHFRPATLARDEFGIAEGGIRLADAAIPTGVNVGTNTGPGACPRWGYYAPFDLATLTKLYPSHAAYVSEVEKTTQQNLKDGFILPVDAQRVITAARQSKIGN